MSAFFTVVIPTYNRANFIRNAINSVRRQTFTRWRLLIVDDASTDDTKEVVSPYLIHPNIYYYRMAENSGVSNVLNTALAMVDTPFLVQLDSDDWLSPNALALLYRAIKRGRRNTALYYGNVNLWKKTDSGEYHKAFHVKHRHFRSKYDFLTYTRWMVAPRCYRVSALREVGGWDTSDPFGGRIMEDRRIILKLVERYPLKWINKTLYNRLKHKNSLTKPSSKIKRNYLRKITFDRYLKRWGNKYRAVYRYSNGYLVIKKLVRRKRK